MTDIWVLSNEAQVISFGSQADHWITIRIHSAEEEQKHIRFSTAVKLFLIAPTPLQFLSNISNFTSVHVLQSEITEALTKTVKVSASNKLVLTTGIAIQQYLKECFTIHNSSKIFLVKNLEFTQTSYVAHWNCYYSAATKRKPNFWLLWSFNYCKDSNFHKKGVLF